MQQEERLSGGVNDVVRIGGTVRRPVGPWTPAVHALLQHVVDRGFDAAPTAMGIDAEGREILTFIAGEVSNYPLSAGASSTSALVSAAQLLRRYHDATVDYAQDHQTGWMLPGRSPVEVICHGDFAPYNCVLAGERAIAIIDFDTAHPGPRTWDVAYSVYRWAPLTAPDNPDGFGTPADQAARVRLFCDAYGLDITSRPVLVDTVVTRLHALVDFMRAGARDGNAAFRRHLEQGHDLLYLRDIDYILGIRDTLKSVLP